MNRFIWRAFVNSATVRMVTVGIVIVLLAGSIFGIWKASSLPTERQKTVTRVSYAHNGEFDYQVYANSGIIYGLPVMEEEANLAYFRKIIDSIDVVFSYGFVPDGAVTGVTEIVEISALLENPGVWQKEVILVPETTKSGDFTVSFPLDLEALDELVDTIDEEIGIGTRSIDVTIVANVHTVAQTGSGVVEDDFVQTTKVTVGTGSLGWEPGLSQSQIGSSGGLSYEQKGEFSYAIHLMENSLYGAITLTPPPVLTKPIVALTTSPVYFTRLIDHVDGSFSYDFSCQPLNQASATVKVTAILEHPGIWSREFDLVPETTEGGDFTVTFPIEFDQFLELANVIRDETGIGSASYDLTITADVHTVGETDYGTIDEVFSQSLTGTLGSTTLKWGNSLDQSQSGSITETVTVPVDTSRAVMWSRLALIFVVLFSFYVVLNYTKVKPVKPTPASTAEAEARQARKKHKDIIIDVEKLPEAKAEEIVISLNSLNDLVKAADALLKPVLYKSEPEKHTYCVIDGLIRYEYVSYLQPQDASSVPVPEEGSG